MNPDEVVVPDVAEPITAWRMWIVRTEKSPRGLLARLVDFLVHITEWSQPLLEGLWSVTWPTRILHAECRSLAMPGENRRGAPHGDKDTCRTCGIYALNSEDLAWQRVRTTRGWRSTHPIAVGRVTLYGRCFEYSEGWRAEWCRIDALTVVQMVGGRLEYDPVMTAQVCAAYEVPELQMEAA